MDSIVDQDPDSPAEALRAVQGAREELARRVVAPWWYHPAFGLVVGGMLAVQAAPGAVRIPVVLALAVCVGVLAAVYQRLTGVKVNGYRAGRTRRPTLITLAVAAVVYLTTLWFATVRGVPAAFVVGGIVLAVVFTVFGRRWDAAYREELLGR